MTCRFNDNNNTSLALVDFDDEDNFFTVEPMLVFMQDGKEVPISAIAPSIKAIDVQEDPFVDGYNLTVTTSGGQVTSKFCHRLYEVFNRICALVRRAMPAEPVSVVWPVLEAEAATEPTETAPAVQVDDNTTPATDAAQNGSATIPWAVLAQPEYVDIWSDIVTLERMHHLLSLLADHTTHHHILWATDSYKSNGWLCNPNVEIDIRALHTYPGIIKTRSQRSKEEQVSRKKKKAEVFTPYWVCNKMNNYTDNEWFGREGVFNSNMDKCELVTPSAGHIQFPDGKTWQDYILSTRLEITCGEAPFIVSRYDAADGKMIPIANRIGQLDRKLRVVNENTSTPEEWVEWAIKSIQNVYGYEWQGDSLLIARVNIVMTFIEYYTARWGSMPDDAAVSEVVHVVAWNFFQMNGLTYRIPVAPDTYIVTTPESLPFAVIYNWKEDRPLEFRSLVKEDPKPAKAKKPRKRRSTTPAEPAQEAAEPVPVPQVTDDTTQPAEATQAAPEPAPLPAVEAVKQGTVKRILSAAKAIINRCDKYSKLKREGSKDLAEMEYGDIVTMGASLQLEPIGYMDLERWDNINTMADEAAGGRHTPKYYACIAGEYVKWANEYLAAAT